MSTVRKHLGGGVLGRGGAGSVLDITQLRAEGTQPGESVQQIPRFRVLPNRFQPRREFSASGLQELADSIQQNGLLSPIVVRPRGDGWWELVAGERRHRAWGLLAVRHEKAGDGLWDTIPAIVRDMSDVQAALLALIENLQRENLTPMEEAAGAARLRIVLIDNGQPATLEHVAHVLGWSVGKASERLKIAGAITPEVAAAAGITEAELERLPKAALLAAAGAADPAAVLAAAAASEKPGEAAEAAAGKRGRPPAAVLCEGTPAGPFSITIRRPLEQLTAKDREYARVMLQAVLKALM